MSKRIAIWLALLVALTLCACNNIGPDVDPIAQQTMIGLSKKDVLACLGAPISRHAQGEGTEIWTYPIGATATDTPPWALGLSFAAITPPWPCDVRVVMTNVHVSQVSYAMPDGRALPSGQFCTFPVQPCARLRELR